MTSSHRVVVLLRVLIASLAAAIAGIHLDLWSSYGYRHIPTIGYLFMLNGVAGSLLAIASLTVPRRVLLLTWVGTAGFGTATLVALLVSINAKLFGFTETSNAPLLAPSIAVEAAAAITGVAAAIWLFNSRALCRPTPMRRSEGR